MNAIVLNGAPPGSLEYSMESASIKSAYLFHTNVVSAGISYMNIFYEDIFMEKKDDLDFMLRYLDAEPAFTKYFKSAAEVRKTMRSIKNNGRKGKQAIVTYNKMLKSIKQIYRLTVEDRLIPLQRSGFPQMKDLSEDLHVLQCEPDNPDSKGDNQLMRNLMLLNSPQEPVIDGGFCHVLYDKAINLAKGKTLSTIEVGTLPNMNALKSEQILGIREDILKDDLGWEAFLDEQYNELRSLDPQEAKDHFTDSPAWADITNKLHDHINKDERLSWVNRTYSQQGDLKLSLCLLTLEDLWGVYNQCGILPDHILQELKNEHEKEGQTVTPIWLIKSSVDDNAEAQAPNKRKTLDID